MKTKIFIPIVLTTSMLLGQSFQQKEILTINDTNSYSAEEFLHVYNKNRDLAEKVDPKSLEEYMELFVNFKLKVLDAEKNEFDKKDEFVKEFDGYKHQIAKNYLTDSYAEEKLIEEAYERMKQQVRASHILITVSETAQPKDTLIAYNKALDVLDQLKSESFEKVAVNNSQDPSVKNNKGDLGFFSSLQMVYPFENAAYSTKVGEYSTPVRTQFGYHILKVTDKRDNPGERQVAHIMLRTSEGKDNNAQKLKIDEIYNQLKDGNSFSDLAKTHSEDMRTASKGGLMDWFGTGKLDKNFEEVAFGLKDLYSFSKPFKTKYGWHIAQLLGTRNISTLEQEKPYIKRKISKNDRAQMANKAFINKLKTEYNFRLYPKNIDGMAKVLTAMNFKEKTQKELNNDFRYKKPIFKYSNRIYTQSHLARDIKSNETKFSQSKHQTMFIYDLLDAVIKDDIIDFEKTQLSSKYPEYKLLVQEYHDGILLYEISKLNIWDKAVNDSTGLQEFYEANQSDYKYGNRVKATIFEVANAKIAKAAKKMINKGLSLEVIEAKLNKKSALNFKSTDGIYSKKDNEIVDIIKWQKGISKNVKKGTGVAFVQINEILDPSIKPLKECKGSVISDYQNELESNWLASLKKTNSIKVNTKLLEEIKKSVN